MCCERVRKRRSQWRTSASTDETHAAPRTRAPVRWRYIRAIKLPNSALPKAVVRLRVKTVSAIELEETREVAVRNCRTKKAPWERTFIRGDGNSEPRRELPFRI